VTQIYELSISTSYHNKMKVLEESRPMSPGGQAKFWAWPAGEHERAILHVEFDAELFSTAQHLPIDAEKMSP
jgi:hypothetical protein